MNRAVSLACGVSFALACVFIFIRAPHPWGTEGFDHYHQLALIVARGGTFPTMEVPWGYAYFLAAFYRLFGDHPFVPLTAQALLNALMPLLVFTIARRWFDERTSVVAAVVTGLFSFNTVYASTQSSDAVCTVIFTTSVLAFLRALDGGGLRWYALTGALAGISPQFRPNLVLVPVVLAAYGLKGGMDRRSLARAGALVACAALALAPWVARNYRLTRMLVPASVHGGVQLWYGTLQVGPYLHSRAYNPRAAFESSAFEYTSLDHLPLLVTVRFADCLPPDAAVSLVHWTNRDATRRASSGARDGQTVTFEVRAPAAPAVFYYEATASRPEAPEAATPAHLFFVSHDHLGDLDIAGDLLDMFDLVRMMRHAAWGEPLRWADRLTAAGIGTGSVEAAVDALLRRFGATLPPPPRVAAFESDARRAVLTLADGSTIVVPRAWTGRVTDLDLRGGLAAALLTQAVPLTTPSRPPASPPPGGDSCVGSAEVAVNDAFYRVEPHRMRRYLALALDNIRRTPGPFVLATAFRAVRLFIVWGGSDRATTQQFEHGRAVNAVATAVSVLFAVLLVVGAAVTWRRRREARLLLLLIAYVPVTVAPMLTNMRYTVTIQPLMFVFVAAALTTLGARAGLTGSRPSGPEPSENRTAHRP